MRPAKGYVLISLTIVVVLLGGLMWYLHIKSESEAQRALQQAAQGFLEEYKDGRFPKPPTASEVWAAAAAVLAFAADCSAAPAR